jgi:hypothetical protein
MSVERLFKFIFEDSQEADHLEAYLSDLAESWSSDERLEGKKAPLQAALKKAGVELSSFELSPASAQGGFMLRTSCPEVFNQAVEALSSPDGLAAMAEGGWLAAMGGDRGTSAEGQFEIYLVSIDGDEEPSDSEKLVNMDKLAKDSYDFVNEPLSDREDEKSSGDNQKGVGSAKDGAKAEKAIHDSQDGFESEGEENAWVDGWAAAKAKKPATDNPHERGPLHDEWLNGWRAAATTSRMGGFKQDECFTAAGAIPAIEAPLGGAKTPPKAAKRRKRAPMSRPPVEVDDRAPKLRFKNSGT